MESDSRPLVAIAVLAVAFAGGLGLHRHALVAAVVRLPVLLVVGGSALALVAVNALVAPIRPEVGEGLTVALVALALVVRLVQVGAGVGRRLEP